MPRTQGHFPEAEKDSVIQIASLVSVQGQATPAVKNIITLNTCSSIVGAEVCAVPCRAAAQALLFLGSKRKGGGGNLNLHDCTASDGHV